MTSSRVVVGMSGGVDSSVAAWLLKEQGYEVIGLFMKNWEDDDDDAYCSTRQDWLDAVSVADILGIDIEAVNFAAEYKDRVFAEFLREYEAGRTPNPDVLCNAEIKFKAFLDHALRLGADHIATGHYARVRVANNGAGDTPRFELLKAVDASKDQSYFLHRLNQAQLSKTLFPLGALHKTEIRAIAARLGLPNAAKKDSTGICFIGERPFREFLNRYLAFVPGPMKTVDGTVVGEHVGLSFYTLGQRKGIGLGGLQNHRDIDGDSSPWYVAHKDVATNTLTIVQGHDHPWLLSNTLTAGQISWVAGYAPDNEPDDAPIVLSAKTRYRQADVECTQTTLDDDRFALSFTQPQWAVTPGQSAVLYRGEVCLGGGIIDAVGTYCGAVSLNDGRSDNLSNRRARLG
ncbi:MAG: tRNA 2-thiouridine(34) synthase MnmA [Pseudomonadota bacterium]